MFTSGNDSDARWYAVSIESATDRKWYNYVVARMSELAFVVFLIHALSEAWGVSTPKVYAILKSSGALDRYIIPYYDVLHTCGSQYLVEDVTGYLKDRGYSV